MEDGKTTYPVADEYTWPVKITTYDAGRDRRLRLSSQLRLQQEVGELHLGSAGLGWEEFYRNGMIFVLVKAASVIHRAPVMDEEVFLRTWHRDTKGVQFYRCYQFLDKEGQILIDSISAFALVEPVEHKLLRPDVFDRFGIRTQPEKTGGCPDPGRLRLPEGMADSGQRPVYWSDTDYNGHLNNAVYADILCDFLPGGMVGRRVTGFQISFLKEALEGENLHITALEKNGEAFVSASHERGRCFDASLTFAEES